MMTDHFEAERRRLRQEMEAEIARVEAEYRHRLEAVDRAEELMQFAASGESEAPVESGDAPAAQAPTPVMSDGPVPAPVTSDGPLDEELRRFVAGRSEPFSLADVEARFSGTPREELRTHLAQMAKAGSVRIIEPGEGGQPTRYEVPEPDYAGVPPRDRSGDSSA